MFLCAKKGQPRSAALQPHMPWQSHSPTLFCLQPLASACSINSVGDVGPMSRPGRPGQSCACGALIKSTNDLKTEGLTCNCKIPGGEHLLPACTPDCPAWLATCLPTALQALPPTAPTHTSSAIPAPAFFPSLSAVHDALDPEMSILKQRIARRLRHEGHTDESVKGLDLGEQAAGCAACMPCSCVPQACAAHIPGVCGVLPPISCRYTAFSSQQLMSLIALSTCPPPSLVPPCS